MAETWMLLAAVAAASTVALVVPRARGLPPPVVPVLAAAPKRSETSVMRLTAMVAVALGSWFFVGGAAGALVAVAAAAACWWLTGRMEQPAVRRRREALTAAVPQAVDLMAACLSAGLSPVAAVEQICDAVEPPLADELAALSGRLRMGVDPATVWRDLARHPQLGGLGRTVSRAVDSGASVADAMQRLAEDLRRQTRAQVETKARAVGVKAALPLGGCLLPAFVLVGVVPLVAGSVTVLLHR